MVVKRRARAKFQYIRQYTHNSLMKVIAKHKSHKIQQQLTNLSTAGRNIWGETTQILKFKYASVKEQCGVMTSYNSVTEYQLNTYCK